MNDTSNRAACRTLALATAIGALALPGATLAQQAGAAASDPGATEPVAVQASAADGAPVAAETGGIETVVVTARRTSEKAQNVPIAVTTVTAKDLKDLTVRDLIEVQKVTPGLLITSSGTAGRAKMTVRGQTEADSRLTSDSSVGVYIDGVNIARDYGLRSSLVDISQIEVLKGPQGTLFGKNTTGGALNITTQHPTYDRGGYVDALYGSYNNRQVLGVANLPLIEDKLAVRLVLQDIKRDGYGHEANGFDAGDDNVKNARLLVRADPADNVRILLSGDYVTQRNHGPNVIITKDVMLQNANTATGVLGAIAKQLGLNPASSADRLSAYNAWKVYFDAYQNGSFYDGFSAANPASAITPQLRDNLDHYGYAADVEVDFGKITAKSITSYRNLRKTYFQDADGTPFDVNFTQQDTTQQNVSQEFQLSSIHGSGLDWQVGLFYNRETGNELAVGNTLDYINVNRGNIQDAGVTNTSKALYAQGVYHVAPALRVTAGIRETKDTRELDSKNRIDSAYAIAPALAFPAPRCNLLSPALGGSVFPNCSYDVSVSSSKATWLLSADWRPIEEVMLYGSVSTGYRTGGFTYQGSSAVQPSANALAAVYAPYRPESVTNYEFGFKSDLSRRLRVNGSLYYQKYNDIQARILDSVNGILLTLIRNAAKATLYGGEVELTAAPIDRLNLTASAGYLHARYDEFVTFNTAGAVLDLSGRAFAAPRLTYNVGANYTIPLADGSVRASANYAWIDTFALVPEATYVDSVTQKAYGLLDARVSWNVKSQGLDIALFGKNLADKRYITSATASEANGWNIAIPGAPRTFGLQVRKTF